LIRTNLYGTGGLSEMEIEGEREPCFITPAVKRGEGWIFASAEKQAHPETVPIQ